MKKFLTMRSRLVMVLATGAFIVAACGSDSDDTTADAESTDTTAAAETEETTADDGATDAAAAEGTPIELGEWFVSDPGELTAGTLTVALSNVGENPHAFAIARGTSYEELPQKENGAVDTDALGADFIGMTENIPPGETGSGDFELEAGDYVLFCPIEFGENSHAAAGQVLSVTVG